MAREREMSTPPMSLVKYGTLYLLPVWLNMLNMLESTNVGRADPDV